ncbi:endonuclease [Vaginella massiliensis]|uniref:endonuclease n=1 Tax=Vaginella massiliensis TaxID=1816680 RepID=UPI003750CFB8
MKKIIFSFGLLLSSGWAFAQIPATYYNNATAEGYTLKTQLKNIISAGYNQRSYDALKSLYTNNSAKNGFKDKYYENDNTILDMYSENPTGSDPYNFVPGQKECGNYTGEGSCYNREHLIAQSYFNQALPMRSDAFHVWPTDGYVNNRRGNYPFGVVANATWTSRNGGKLGVNANAGYSAGYSGMVFEPIDEFKGDIARAFFYFATRYEDRLPNFYSNRTSTNVGQMFDGSSNKSFTDTFFSILYTWHIMDPVSQRERDINDLIYYEHQNNRNPYIDHPEWVEKVWKTNLAVDDITYQDRHDISVYTQANKIVVRLENASKAIDQVTVYNLNGQVVKQVKNTAKVKEVNVSMDSKGIFIIKVEGQAMEINRKVVLN